LFNTTKNNLSESMKKSSTPHKLNFSTICCMQWSLHSLPCSQVPSTYLVRLFRQVHTRAHSENIGSYHYTLKCQKSLDSCM
jgi:hypothetical protein